MLREYPSQPLQDWLSQRWVMWRGRRVEPSAVPWLMGPFGEVDAIADHYVARLAAAEGLTVERHTHGVGLLESFDELALDASTRARLDDRIVSFYEETADFSFEVWSQWNLLFRPFAGLIHRLYSRRLQQLNLPLKPMDTSRGFTSEVLKLRGADGVVRHTIWHRSVKATGQVIYSGVYGTCRLPDGQVCVKVVFPLPRGNATVILRVEVDADGGLVLTSRGAGFGSPGFYFLLRDRKSRHWAQFIRTFRERIHVYVDDEGVLRTDHRLSLWGLRTLELHYRMGERSSRGE